MNVESSEKMNIESWVKDFKVSRSEGWTLPQLFYSDWKILNLEFKYIFKKRWIYAGHVSQIPNVGDYLLYTVGNDSIIIIRGKDDIIRGLSNTCRHRGSLVCTEICGNVKSLVCPYHQWVYGLDGKLKAARLMSDNFPKDQYGLDTVHCRVLEGFIFISLSEKPPLFERFAEEVGPALHTQGIDQAKVCHTEVFDVHSNWKLIAENFRECYHCPGSHHEYCNIMFGIENDDYFSNREAPRYSRFREERIREWEKLGVVNSRSDLSPENWYHHVRMFFKDGVETQSIDGRPVAPLMSRTSDYITGPLAGIVLPAFWFESSSDHAVTMRHTPIAPNRTRTELQWLVSKDAIEGKDYSTEKVSEVWKTTGQQDWKLCADNQAGIESSRYRPAPYAECESECEVFLKWYLNQLCA